MNYAVIAAGEGSRLANEGIACPKAMVELDGRPLIGRLLDIFMTCDATLIRVIINSHNKPTLEYLQSLSTTLPLQIVVCDTPSSLHSLEALHLEDTPGKWCVTTVDTVFDPTVFEGYIKYWKESTTDAMMAITEFVDDEKPLFVTIDEHNRITTFSDAPTPSPQYVSGGIYGLSPKAIAIASQCVEAGESRMRNYQRALLHCGLSVEAYLFNKIIDVDHAADIAVAQTILHTQP